MMNEARRGEEESLRVEGRGCVFGRQVVFGYPLRNRDAGANQGVHEIGGTPGKRAVTLYRLYPTALSRHRIYEMGHLATNGYVERRRVGRHEGIYT